jgi:outer membrane receptor protein involved in Fe transport
VTWTHGRHNVKAGFSVAHLDNYNNSAGADSKPEGAAYYGGLPDFLDDAPSQYTLITLSGKTGAYQANILGSQVAQFGLYAQDDWKVKPNLLVTLGHALGQLRQPVTLWERRAAFPQHDLAGGIYAASEHRQRQAFLRARLATHSVPPRTSTSCPALASHGRHPRIASSQFMAASDCMKTLRMSAAW